MAFRETDNSGIDLVVAESYSIRRRLGWIRWLAAFLVAASLALAAWMGLRWRSTQSLVPAHTFTLDAESRGEWTAYGGNWTMAQGAVHSNSYERGAKLLAGSSFWSDYTVSADMLYRGPAADMGIVIRANDESRGVDAYNGYFVGLRSLDDTLVMGRAGYAWLEVPPAGVPGGVEPFTWYRLRVTAYGCHVAASVTNLATQQAAYIAFEEHFCIKSGRFGLRALNANAEWRNVRVEPATWASYHDLVQHAAYVRHPVIVNGPPWWTPWHVIMLFTATLVLAMLVQLGYFRLQNWKTTAISRERERMAQEIHDSMAQGFAGIGYQIQGIRTGITRSGSVDTRNIVEQLNVTYQLVRSCHKEASRTIALLAQTKPSIENDLLGELVEIARKTAPGNIRILSELQGEPAPLNLRVADALLHIGREAIINGLSHGNPSALKIALSFRDNTLEMVIEDDGSGFEYAQKKEGFGILSMHKRARGVDSLLEIRSVPGLGTEVRVKTRLRSAGLRGRVTGLWRWKRSGRGSY